MIDGREQSGGSRGRRGPRWIARTLAALLILGGVAAADAAFEFRADQLTIFRAGQPFFSDAFEDGNPQLAPGGFAGGGDGQYFIAGTPTEVGGRLVLNSIGAADPGLFIPVSFELALLDTSTSLSLDTSFAIFSRWDLILPPPSSFSAYELGLTDATGSDLGNDRVNLSVVHFPDGTLEVAFRAQDPLDPTTFLTLDTDPLDAADFLPGRQIDLALVKADADPAITAFWRFVDGLPLPGDLTGFTPLGGSRDIFTGETFTRVQLNAFEDRSAVPGPPTVILLGVAVACALRGRPRRA